MSEAGMVIVGAGEAGGRAALALREAGFSGPVTIVGDEPHAPYERPPLSKAVMTCEEEPAPTFSLDAERARDAGITHRPGTRAVAIDRNAHALRLADGRIIPYDRLLLATGAHARRLAIPGGEHALYLRNFADALALRRCLRPGAELIVIGGGFIGLELAASAVARDARVVVIEMAPRLLSRCVPEAIATRMQARHETAGVTFRMGVGIARIEREGGRFAAVFSDGSRIAGNSVVGGVGAIPETQLAAEAGLAIDNGIAVGETLATSDPDIFAAGDCCSFPHPLYGGRRIRLEAWRNAQDQGAAVAKSMLGATEPYAAVPWFWSDQYDETLQIAGLADAGTRTVERSENGASLIFHLDDSGRLVAASAVGPNARIARDVRLAEMLVAARAAPDPAALADSGVTLKSLLKR